MISTTTPTRSRGRARSALLTGVAALLVLLGIASVPATAGAETLRSKSTIVAVSAAQALAAYDSWVASGDAGDKARFDHDRDLTAAWVAQELWLPADQLDAAWDAAPTAKQVAVLAALSQVGVPYRRNTSKEGVGFDCSGLTTYAWARAGVVLPRNSGAQIRAFTNVDVSQVQAGDLVYYPGHVSMSLGLNGAIVHARQPGATVEMTFSPTRRSLRYADPVA